MSERERRQTAEHAGTLPFRMDQLEDHVREQRDLNQKLNEGLWAIRMSIDGGMAALSARVDKHDIDLRKREKFSQGVMLAIAAAVIGALVTFAVRTRNAQLPGVSP